MKCAGWITGRAAFAVVVGSVVLGVGCGDSNEIPDGALSAEALASRAYVISEQSDDLFIVDLRDMQEVATVDIGNGNGLNASHMSVLSPGADKLYVTAAHQGDVVVFDTQALQVARRIPVGAHPSHASPCLACPPNGRDELWVVNEDDNSLSIIDMGTDEVIQTLRDSSLMVPHFVRFANGSAYIPSIGGNQITVIDLDTRRVSDVLLLDGQTEVGACSADPCGFADAQIDGRGLLVAAHIETGKVLMYDTQTHRRIFDLAAGDRPWAVFVDQMSDVFDTYVMPNWGDATVSVLDRIKLAEVARTPHGDRESYGVNYSPLRPEAAFVLNRTKESVAIIDRETGSLSETIDVGGTTETASTTEDGQHLLLPLSSTGEFVILDVLSGQEVARFANVGVYPWSVTTVGGQNYCH